VKLVTVNDDYCKRRPMNRRRSRPESMRYR